ncbi:hypothetical protein [Shewanella gaetbuli]|uniref:Uncharacterized protein n=1 Tax=Shewanella gaetbuli TaxID=220752 RepID=A0A9X1ZJ36_9GAMM|nr:hypothetical protein [Shewanella gaetbuli]MCL1143259.1 hypothetical protein [Shewanella gaetbuli]
MMRKLTAVALAITALTSSAVFAEISQDDFNNGLVTASANGSSVADFMLAQMTANPADSADILGFALLAANQDEAVITQVLQSAASSGMDPDDILAIAIANGVDPATVTSVLAETQTAAGGTFGAAPTPGGAGFGGGSGGGGGTISGN